MIENAHRAVRPLDMSITGYIPFQAGWEPMTPLDMGLQMKETGKAGPQVTLNEAFHKYVLMAFYLQVTICFKRKEDLSDSSATVNSSELVSEHSCLCLETYGSNYLGRGRSVH